MNQLDVRVKGCDQREHGEKEVDAEKTRVLSFECLRTGPQAVAILSFR